MIGQYFYFLHIYLPDNLFSLMSQNSVKDSPKPRQPKLCDGACDRYPKHFIIN